MILTHYIMFLHYFYVDSGLRPGSVLADPDRTADQVNKGKLGASGVILHFMAKINEPFKHMIYHNYFYCIWEWKRYQWYHIYVW